MTVRYRFRLLAKRAIDVAVSAVALVALAPVFGLVALVIKCSSPGPVFYRAKRAGYRGREIWMLKFRSMHADADRHGAITGRYDPRVFPAGRILRVLKIDELPQLWNVLKGDLSLVGPRPEDLDIVEHCYTARQREVLNVKPGLTGIPQVVFYPEFPRYADHLDPDEHYEEYVLPMRLQLDLEYIRRQSLRLDLWLVMMTVFVIAHRLWRIVRDRSTQPSGETAIRTAREST